MHEMAITKKLIQDILMQIRGATFQGVRRVVVDVGELTSYESSPMRYYFDILKQEHDILKKAELRVSMVPGEEIVLRELEVE